MSGNGARFAKLLDLAHAQSSEKRRELLREATDLFFETSSERTSRETQLFDDVLRTVAKEMEESVLAELAERFADSYDAPAQLLHDLASNTIAVAEPVLRRSPILKEDVLVKLVSEQSQDHIRAIAQRETVSPRVSDAIVRVGNDDALETLLGNAGATIERPAMERVLDRARDNARLHGGIVGRHDIPLDLLNEMYFIVEQKLRTAILERNSSVDPSELDQALERARLRMQSRQATAVTDDFRQAQKLIEQKKRAGELKAPLLVALYRDNKITAFTLGLAELTGLDYDTAHGIIAKGDMEALAMICRSANFERPLFVTIAVLCCGGNDAMKQAEHFGRIYSAVPVEAAQRAMRFFKVRKGAGEQMAA